MRILLLGALLALSCAALAGDWLVASVASYHLDRRGQNEFNPGIGAEIQLTERWRAIGGTYLNSSSHITAYGGAVYGIYRAGAMHLGAMAVLATGYDAKPVLIAGTVVSLEGRSAGVNVLLIPASRGVLAVQLKVPW